MTGAGLGSGSLTGALLQPAWALGGGCGDQGSDLWEVGPQPSLTPLVTQRAITPSSL